VFKSLVPAYEDTFELHVPTEPIFQGQADLPNFTRYFLLSLLHSSTLDKYKRMRIYLLQDFCPIL